MSDPLDTPTARPPRWEALQETIHNWLVVRFGLTTPRDKDIWLYCIGTALELERLAVAVLWVDDGRPKSQYEYEKKMTLGDAHREIEKRGLLDPVTRTVLKDVADLRNSVAHRRQAIFVTTPSPIAGQSVGEYKGYQVFMYREALDELIGDHEAAAQSMYDWIVEKAPDMAEHPTPP
jgi:hypothetical protein